LVLILREHNKGARKMYNMKHKDYYNLRAVCEP